MSLVENAILKENIWNLQVNTVQLYSKAGTNNAMFSMAFK